jgi:pimeloyl-ACP methyl ester carboxylesterase
MKKLFPIAILFIAWTQSLTQSPTDKTAALFTSHDGTKIYYEVQGTGQAVILIHGFVVNSESWKTKALYSDLIKKNYKVITIDLRGNGKSDKPHSTEAYLNDAEAKDIMRLADTLGLEKYSAIGYSRGSIITSRLLVLDPRVEKAVLGGMGDDFIDPNWPRRIMFYEVLAGLRPPGELEGFLKYVNDSGLDQQALAMMQYGQPSTSKEELAKIGKPVLVICGTEDEDNGSSEKLAQLIPNSKYVRVPGVHNNAHQSEEFSREVIGFLER